MNSSLLGTTALLIFCALCVPAQAGEVTGRASIVDADTIDIGKVRIRFADIDAMESDQLCTDDKRVKYLCGQEAANALADLLSDALQVGASRRVRSLGGGMLAGRWEKRQRVAGFKRPGA